MQKKLIEQTKTIEYIKTKYKERTGEEIVMPRSWEDYLCIDPDDAPAQPLPLPLSKQQEVLTFQLSVDRLSLPSRISYSKPPFSSFSPANPCHMIEIISLNNFKQLVHFLLWRASASRR